MNTPNLFQSNQKYGVQWEGGGKGPTDNPSNFFLSIVAKQY